MDFVAVVDQAIALLRQRDRLTYRTLQLQFQLDDGFCRKFCSGGHEGAVAPVCGGD